MAIETIHACWHWLTEHPLSMATMFYVTGVVAVLVYAYFEAKPTT